MEQIASKYISSEILAVLEKLESNGFSAFIVGGCVRDMLLGIPPKDFDIATDALPSEVVDIFDKAGHKCLEIGKKYGTISVSKTPIKTNDSAKNDSPKTQKSPKNMQSIEKSQKRSEAIKATNDEAMSDFVEITTFRKDSAYIDGRHPQRVEFGKSICEDLSRRDFTINALALAPHKPQKISDKSGDKGGQNSGQIIDIYGGVEDLKRKRVACVGNPSERFSEDYLRILRALRFSSVLGFAIEPKTKRAIKKQIQKLDYLPKERINAEFSKLLLGDFACEVLSEYSEVLGVIFGESTMRSCRESLGFSLDFDLEGLATLGTLPPQLPLLAPLKNAPKDLVTRLSVLCYGLFAKDFGKDFATKSSETNSTLKNALKNLRYSNEITSQVCFLVSFANVALAKIYEAGQCQKSLKIALKLLAKECAPNALIAEQKMLALFEFLDIICDSKPKIAQAKSSFCQVLYHKECFCLSHLAIKGDEVKSILQKIKQKHSLDSLSSKRVGEVLDFLLRAVIEEQIPNTKSALKSASEKYLHDLAQSVSKTCKEEKC
ncbi:CCA tRNA nucleotidyltransferase [Helicobacter macacae]|uniref:Poly A polymerase head domain-containing protein n=1 Tax=Helicobacter macacae MIT 99-5501 TaxID=1357400 RepID=V8CDS7_9HELI|nr:CCA tRNA nucleotidyltransferase [Helicobacter macacae]ETD25257.1 hypothetical protein HMPREF2086_00597 [Helicobacter macacae MIT 99-5501]